MGYIFFCHHKPNEAHLTWYPSGKMFLFPEIKQLRREGNYSPTSRADVQISWILSFLYLKRKLQKFISELFSYEMISPNSFLSEEGLQIDEIHTKTNASRIWIGHQTERGWLCMVFNPLTSERDRQRDSRSFLRSSCSSTTAMRRQ
jgi:hypothetical protein